MTKNLDLGKPTCNVTETDLEAMFTPFATVQRAQIIAGLETNGSKGFGSVEMDTDAQAQAAIRGLHDREQDGRRPTVNKAKPRIARVDGGYVGSRHGGGGGGGHGGGGSRY